MDRAISNNNQQQGTQTWGGYTVDRKAHTWQGNYTTLEHVRITDMTKVMVHTTVRSSNINAKKCIPGLFTAHT